MHTREYDNTLPQPVTLLDARVGTARTPMRMSIWNYLYTHRAIGSIMTALDRHMPGILALYATSPYFHLQIHDTVHETLDITATAVQGWEEHGITRRIDVIMRLSGEPQLVTLSFGDNGYPIQYSVGAIEHPILEKCGGQTLVHPEAKGDIKPFDRAMEQRCRLAYLPLAEINKGVRGPELEYTF